MIVALEAHRDSRGYFARTFCVEQFSQAGIEMRILQTNISHNPHVFTLRGMHYQAEPHGEAKVVQCVRGRIYDVAVDLRAQSSSFRRWAAVELGPEFDRVFYIPPGCAHGFLTLEPDSDIVYLMGAAYTPGTERGVRWNDPAIGIEWPEHPQVIAAHDASYPDLGSFIPS